MKAIRSAAALFFMLTGSATFAHAQYRVDLYFGMGTARAESAHRYIDFFGTGNLLETPALDGVFGTVGGAVMLTPSFGIGAQASFRFRQGDYAGLGYRPIFYDFNGVWTPSLNRRIMPEFQGGFGGAHLRFYDATSPYYDYYTGRYSTFAGSSNHLQLHAGAGLRIFIRDHIFVRPQVDYRWVRNMTEFGSSSFPSYSIAIGYSSSE